MDERDLVKNLVKAWVRYDLHLQSVESQVLNDLSKEGAAHQLAQWLFQNVLNRPDQRRELALRLAIAEFQEGIAQL